MLGRAWACVLLIATLTGCASRSRPQPFLPSMTIPLECTTSIRLVGCALIVSSLLSALWVKGQETWLRSSTTARLPSAVGAPGHARTKELPHPTALQASSCTSEQVTISNKGPFGTGAHFRDYPQ